MVFRYTKFLINEERSVLENLGWRKCAYSFVHKDHKRFFFHYEKNRLRQSKVSLVELAKKKTPQQMHN